MSAVAQPTTGPRPCGTGDLNGLFKEIEFHQTPFAGGITDLHRANPFWFYRFGPGQTYLSLAMNNEPPSLQRLQTLLNEVARRQPASIFKSTRRDAW
jgi:hypothetical protein